MRPYLMRRYRERRAAAVERLGGCCVDCGTTERLEFDHRDAQGKSYDVGKFWTRRDWQAEVDKCDLRCRNCHTAKSLRSGDLPVVGHGEGAAGKSGCLCTLCKERKAQYMKERAAKYRENRRRKRAAQGDVV